MERMILVMRRNVGSADRVTRYLGTNSFSTSIDPGKEAGMSNISLLSGISGLSFHITLLSPLLLLHLLLLHFLSCPFFLLLC